MRRLREHTSSDSGFENVLGCRSFPLVLVLPSTNSAEAFASLFASFTGTMTKSDSSKTYMFRILDVSPSLTGLLAQTLWRSPGSRAHCFLTCWESSTTPSPAAASDLTLPAGVAFPQAPKGRHSDCNFTELDGPPVSASVYASHSLLADTMARLEVRMESLLLFRRALPSPTMCRLIPALGAPCSPQRTWAENDVFECFCSIPQLFSLEQLFARTAKTFEGATPRLFRPTYAEANVGHPS